MAEPTDTERLDLLVTCAEAAYAAMYDAPDFTTAAARYSDAKEALHTAIELARKLGRRTLAGQLSQRLVHIKDVYRSQFS